MFIKTPYNHFLILLKYLSDGWLINLTVYLEVPL